jgi:hypothetical protein
MSVQLMAHVEPFPISVPCRDLSDLRARLDRVRLPEPEVDASQGLELDRLQTLLEAWRQRDWRALEKRWNAIPHYRIPLDGLDIAFWHVPSPEPDALPLVLTHGWPGSVLELENISDGSPIPSRTVVPPKTPSTWSSQRSPGLGSANGPANQAGIPDVPRGRGPT